MSQPVEHLEATAGVVSAGRLTVEELRTVSIFADLPQDGVEWLAAQMTAHNFQPGETVVSAGDPADRLFVLLSGEIGIERNNAAPYIATQGQITGMLPYSRLTHYPVSVRAFSHTRIGMLVKDRFDEMLERLPVLHQRLVSVLADRIRESTIAQKQQEKLAALGKMSAGLAHELNNPAAAIRRAADNMGKVLRQVRTAALTLDKKGLPNEARLYLAHLDCDWASQVGPQSALDSLDRSEREEEFLAWLEAHDVAEAWNLASTLVDLGCSRETLEEVSRRVPPQFLSDALTRLTASFSVSRLAEEISSSAGKISELVRAVKEYSYMDQAPEQEIDIHDGIENTLIMLGHRLKHGIEVVREYDRSLPVVCARGSELNQVWTNLIANAADAMGEKGRLLIRTRRVLDSALVEIIDNGPGIPAEVQSRIFEPFFTTKPVGEGTGLGLDAVQSIIRSHHGSVDFASRPGETRFSVRLPFAKPASLGPGLENTGPLSN